MRGRGVVLVVILAAVAVAGGWVGWLVRFRPLTVFAWQTRLALRIAGLHKVMVPASPGPQVAFVGGAGPAVVLLHGAGDNAGTWFRVVPELVKGHTLIVPDVAGHGDSAPKAGPIAVPDILAGLEAVIEEVGRGRKVALVGNSLGAWMAMLVAHRHPGWVEQIIAVDGGALTGHRAVKLLPTNRDEARQITKLLRDPSSPPIPGFVLDDVVRQAREGPLARFAATASTMEQWTLDGRLGELQAPVRLIWGNSDQLLPLDYAQRMLAELPHATLVTLERCGHVPQIECPTALIAALEEILNEPAVDAN